MADRDEDFAAMLEASLAEQAPARRLRRGQKVHGTVVAITDGEVFLDIGAKAEGRVPRSEFTDPSGAVTVQVGDRVSAVVVDPHAPEGPRLAVRLGGAGGPAALSLARSSGLPVRGRVAGTNRGGLEVDLGGRATGFCPASQVELGRAADLQAYVGKTLDFVVTEVRDRGRSVVLSRRPILEKEAAARAEQRLAELEPGLELEGTVDALEPYGAFVDLGGVRGLLHAKTLERDVGATRPADLFRVGETIRVRVEHITPDSKGGSARVDLRFIAALEAVAPPPIVAGTVERVESGGLWVTTDDGEVFVPARELDLPPGADPRRVHRPGTSVEVVLLGKDRRGRTRGSVRRVDDARARVDFRDFQRTRTEPTGSLGRLGDLLAGVQLPSVARAPSSAKEPTPPPRAKKKAPADSDDRPKGRRRRAGKRHNPS